MAKRAPKTFDTIDAYLAAIENPTARETLTALRAQLRKLLPKATETFSYNLPALRVGDDIVAGFAFFGRNCGFYPFSGSVIPKLKKELAGLKVSKGAVSFPPDQPLKASVVKALVKTRLAEIASGKKPARSPRRRVADRPR